LEILYSADLELELVFEGAVLIQACVTLLGVQICIGHQVVSFDPEALSYHAIRGF
jgi:hypothetical protein